MSSLDDLAFIEPAPGWSPRAKGWSPRATDEDDYLNVLARASGEVEFTQDRLDAMDARTYYETLASLYNRSRKEVTLHCFGTRDGICNVGKSTHELAVDHIVSMCMARQSDSVVIVLTEARHFSDGPDRSVDLLHKEVPCKNISEVRDTLKRALSQMHTFFERQSAWEEYFESHETFRDGYGFKHIHVRFKKAAKKGQKL